MSLRSDIVKFLAHSNRGRVLFIPTILALACLFGVANPASAHDAEQQHFLKVNGSHLQNYLITTISLPDFVFPQEFNQTPLLVNQPIKFEIEKNNIPLPDKSIADNRFIFDFGDGHKALGSSTTHTYSQIGSFILTISVQPLTDSKLITIDRALINIVPNASYRLPHAVIKLNGAPISAREIPADFGAKVDLDGTASSAQSRITNYYWDLGDRQSSDKSTLAHSYSKEDYGINVLLRVKDDKGFIADTAIRLRNVAKPDRALTFPFSGTTEPIAPIYFYGGILISLALLMKRPVPRRVMKTLSPLLIIILVLGAAFDFDLRPVLAQTSSTTVNYQISNGADDVNQDGSTFDPSPATIWLGTAGSTTSSYTGLRFNNVAIPRNSTITSAYFQVYSSSSQWITFSYDIYGDASGNSPVFSATNMPSNRTLTTNKTSHSSNVQWLANTWYQSDNFSSVIQEIVNRIDWQSGNSLSLILKGTGGAWARKYAMSYEGNPVNAPKLTIIFQASSGSAGPVISNVSASGITTSTATINWTTDVPSDSQVDYGTTSAYGSSTSLDPTMVTSHSRWLSGLSANTTYHYHVKSRDASGNLSASSDYTFTTLYDTNPNLVGQWSGVMNWPLVAVHMALMPTGQVLMWDAWEYGSTPSSRLWNPQTQSFTSVPNNYSALFCSAQAMLANGNQLVVGGHNGSGVGIPDTNIFNYVSSTWSRVGDMAYPRWYPSAATLPDGRVLTVGGTISSTLNASTPEVFAATTNAWTTLPGGVLNVGEYPNIYTAPNGKVFMISGVSDVGNGTADGISRYFDVGSQSWQTVTNAPVRTGTSVMYQPGKILASGGSGTVDLQTAVIDLNQASPTWAVTAPMNYARYLHNLVVLPDGKVFAVGGSDVYSLSSTTGILQSEIWDPTTMQWTTMVPMQNLRLYHSTALLLPDGRILVAGGGRLSPAIDYLTAEIYSPTYLFKGNRPTITSAPGSSNYNSNFVINTPDAANITSVSLVRLSSVTHAFNMDERFVPLTFTAGSGSLSVQSPANSNIAPPGYYMLFILNSAGVPSVASMVQIGSGFSSPPTATATPTASGTITGTATFTPTPTQTATNTSTATATSTSTTTPTATPTSTNTGTPTSTFAPTPTSPPTSTSTPSSTPTPSNTSTNTPTRTPSSTPSQTSTPTATRMPSPSSTPTFSTTPTKTATPTPFNTTIQIIASADNVNEDGSIFTSGGTTLFIGNGASMTGSYTGLRFNNVAIPKTATILSAQLQFYSSKNQQVAISVNMAAQAIGNSAPFSASNKPSQQTLTVNGVSQSFNTRWNPNSWYSMNDISPVIQELINRSDWTLGNSLSIVIKGTGSSNTQKYFDGFDAGASKAAKLIVTYR